MKFFSSIIFLHVFIASMPSPDPIVPSIPSRRPIFLYCSRLHTRNLTDQDCRGFTAGNQFGCANSTDPKEKEFIGQYCESVPCVEPNCIRQGANDPFPVGGQICAFKPQYAKCKPDECPAAINVTPENCRIFTVANQFGCANATSIPTQKERDYVSKFCQSVPCEGQNCISPGENPFPVGGQICDLQSKYSPCIGKKCSPEIKAVPGGCEIFTVANQFGCANPASIPTQKERDYVSRFCKSVPCVEPNCINPGDSAFPVGGQVCALDPVYSSCI